MAPRVQVDTSSLRRLNPKTAVVARPVDTMVSVSNQVQQNSQLMQTANALAQVNPKLNQYLQDGQLQRNKDDQEEGTAAWQKANDEEKKAYLKAIKSGKIDEVESPFFIKGMSKGVLRDRARDYGQQLVIGWNAQKGTKGFNLDKFLSESKEAYIKEHGLDGFADNIFNSEFGRLAEAYGNQVSQRNYEDRLKKTRQARLTLLGKDVVGAAAKATNNAGEFNATTYIAEVNKVMEQAISEGLDPTNSRQQVLAQLQALATTDVENSKAYIDAAAQLSTRYGKYGETGKGALWVAEKNDFFERKLEQDEDDDWQQNQRDQANAIMDAEQAMYQNIVKNPKYLDTDVGQSALDTLAGLRGGGGESAQRFKNQHEHDAKVVTDPEELAAVVASIESGAGNDTPSSIDKMPNISGPDKNLLKKKLGDGPRLEVAQTNLGPVNYVAVLEKYATKADPVDPLGALYGNSIADFSDLSVQAQIAATSIILQADKDFDLSTLEGKAGARAYIKGQMDAYKKDVLDPARDEIRGRALQKYNNDLGANGGLNTNEGGSVNPVDAVEAREKGVLAKALPIYTYLPPSILENAAVEAKRPVSKILPKVHDGFEQGPILDFTDNDKIDALMKEFTEVLGNPERPFSESRLVNMAMQYGVTVDELGTEITSNMVANLKAKNEEEERLKQAALVDLTDDQTEQVLQKMSENSLDPANMNDVAVAASELFPFVTSDQIAKLHNKLNIKPETIDYSSDDADDEAETDTTTLLETVSEAVAPYISGTGETDEAMFKASDGQFFDKGTDDTGEAMFKASGGQFFKDGEGTLTEQAVGAVAEAASDLVAPYISGTGDRYDNEAMFEASDGQFFDKGTVELPPSIQGGLLSQEDYDAMSVDAQQRADEKATAIQAEAIGNVGSPRDINTAIVDLGEGFVKTVASSFEATGKAGAARTRELQQLETQQALYIELSKNPNVEAQELARKIELATSEDIGIGKVDNSKLMAELLELRDPDKALAAAQKFLSPEAKQRIAAGPIMPERLEPQPPVDLRGRSSPTAQTAAQEIDTTGTVKLGSTPTETGKQVFKLRSVLEQNGKVPKLSDMKNAVRGEKAKKLVARSWQDAFGKHYRVNGTAKPAFMRQALDIAKQTETDVTVVIKAVLGTNPSPNKLFVTSGLTTIEAQQLHTKYQEIRKLFEQMNKDN